MPPKDTLTLLFNLLRPHLHPSYIYLYGGFLTEPCSFLLCILPYALPFAKSVLFPSSLLPGQPPLILADSAPLRSPPQPQVQSTVCLALCAPGPLPLSPLLH